MSATRLRLFAVTATLIGVISAIVALYFGQAQAQSQPPAASSSALWQEVDQSNLVQSASLTTIGDAMPTRYRLFRANLATLDAILAQAPQEGSVQAANAATVLTLPMPDGKLQRFAIAEYALLEPAFAAAHPEMKTYLGRGLDNPLSTVQISRTPWGFHSQVLTGGRLAFVDPQPDATSYLVYSDQALPDQQFSDAHIHFNDALSSLPTTSTVSGDRLHRYRLAVAATSEFTQEAGGVQAAQSKIVAFVNDMNGIYARDLSVRFVLMDNTNIIYPIGGPDPYSNGNAGAMLNENQANLDQVIGNANYDVGYALGTNMGGVAGLGAVCVTGRKASGSGSIGNVSLHEIAHLFGGGHTFNANSAAAGSCNGGNYMAESAYEPGSGSTILAYAGGICSTQNLQDFKVDTYFHAISIQEMTNYITNGQGNSCGTHDATGNAPPTVNAGQNRTIPARTAFTLVGQATDPNGDPLTYTWEEFDRGQAWTGNTLPNTDLGNNPIFRSYPPTGENFRSFPSLTSPFAAKGESLPTTDRTLNFRLTVRDGKGGVNAGDVAVQVVSTAGPFVLTAPQAGAIWAPGSPQAVTWNVANTNQPPISCAAVDILASADSGKTYTALVQNTANDGAENVTAPFAQSAVLVKVACANNIFHAISPNPGVNICNAVFVDNHEAGTANWTATSSNTRGWELKTNGGYSGANYWFTSFFGFGTTSLDSQPRTANLPNLTLTFQHRYFFTPAQTGKVQINVNNGGWQDLKGFAGKAPTYDSSYAAEIVPLNNFVKVNDTFQLRFQRDTACCDGVSGNPDDGWFLDDVSVCGAVDAPPTPTATATTPANPTPTNTVAPESTATNTPVPTATPIPVIGAGEVTWTGNGATVDWNDGANWNGGQPPNGTQNVIIPAGLANYPTISNNAAVKDLKIASGAVVNMTAGILTVRGNWGGGNADGRQEICQDLTGGENGNPTPKLFGRNAVSDTLIIPIGGRLTDLNVFLDVNHTWVGDVVANLRHGDHTVTLLDPSDDNCDADNFAITLDDEGGAPVAPACVTGNTPAFAQTRYQPNQALTVFDNQTFAGAWVLTLQDVFPDADDGQLRKWCLNVTSDTPVGRFNATGGRVVFSGEFAHMLLASPDSTFHDIQISEGSAQQVNLGSDLDINGSLELAAGAALHVSDGTIKLAGNWVQADNANFDPGNGAVIFDGGQQGITGSPHFNKLTINDGCTLEMSDYELVVDSLFDNDGVIRQTKLVNGNGWVTFNDAGGYGGLDINANGLDLGLTTVTISQNELGCTSEPGETIQRCFTIEPTNTTERDADLRFYYDDEEQSQNSCSNMQAYQFDATNDLLFQLNRFATRCSISPRGLWVDGVTDFTVSEIVLGAAVGEPGSRADEPPVAISDTVLTELDTAITIEALQNDFDPEGASVTLDSIGQPSHGTATLTRGGQIDYTPNAGFAGEDRFNYEISDINDNKSSGEIIVTVRAVTQQVFLPLIRANSPQQQVDTGWRMAQ
jgi:Metallo-peptidase family M12B Reprolysin-like/Bacterial Ig domain